MMKSSQLTIIAILLAVTIGISSGCKRKGAPGATAAVEDSKASVCLIDGIAIRDTPAKTGKYIATVSLGEKVKWKSGPQKDSAGKDYIKIELSDGKTGWTSSYGIITGAVIGVVKDDVSLFKRPDMLTASNQKLKFMTLVAITQEKDGWCQITSEGKRVTGWIKKDDILQDNENVTAAILATRKMREKDGLDQAKKVEAIIASSPHPSSNLIQTLRERQTATLDKAPVPLDNTDPEPKQEQGQESKK